MTKEQKKAISIFKSSSLYKKLFLEFKKKYESLGRIGGTISLIKYSDKEIDELAEFFGIRPDILFDKRKVTLIQFEKQLKTYRFNDIGLKELLELYFEESLVSNKERKAIKSVKQWSYFNLLKIRYEDISVWIDYLEEKTADTYWIYRMMDQSNGQFESYVKLLERARQNLPDVPVRLPVFAQLMTGNPHAFDRNQNLGRLFIHFLTVKKANYLPENVVMPTSSEDINELLLGFNILRDDITNFITVANLQADTGGNKEKLWKVACETHSVQNVPIRELLHVEKLYPANKANQVWVVENSGVFSSILDEIPEAPLMCTHGQFKLAAWKCFDMLVAEGVIINYSSDIDPEGLGMAARLMSRYPNSVQLWRMDSECYEKSVSREDTVSPSRLNQLKNLSDPIFFDLIDKVKENKSPAYQEALLDDMIGDLKNQLN